VICDSYYHHEKKNLIKRKTNPARFSKILKNSQKIHKKTVSYPQKNFLKNLIQQF
jgi:hypothetical protein